MRNKFNRIILLVIVSSIFLSFCSCVRTPSSFIEAYEQKNTIAMIHFAVSDDLLLNVGFIKENSDFGSYRTSLEKYKKDYGDVELSYWQGNGFITDSMSYGKIETEVNDWKLSITFCKNKMIVNISSGTESMTANLLYDFKPIDTKAPAEDGIHLNWILARVDFEEIKSLCNQYEEITDEVMTEIYNNCKSE